MNGDSLYGSGQATPLVRRVFGGDYANFLSAASHLNTAFGKSATSFVFMMTGILPVISP
jgi:hypothetical protein